MKRERKEKRRKKKKKKEKVTYIYSYYIIYTHISQKERNEKKNRIITVKRDKK